MPKPFDATLKALLETSPRDWPVLCGYPARSVAVIDADVSTVTAAADKVLRVRGPSDWLLHVEFQASPDAALPRRLLGYNALLDDRHDVPVRSAVILLRPQADLTNLTGVYERGLPGEAAHLWFAYQVLRVWQLPVERLLRGGLSTLPLAPISNVTPGQLPEVLARMTKRLRRWNRRDASQLWTATYVLMGLRYEEALIDQVLRGVLDMEESVTYQAIIAKGIQRGRREGAVEELRKTLLLLGRKQFGQPDARAKAVVEGLNDLQRLEELILRVSEVSSWQDLLGLPARPHRRRGSSS